MPKSPDREDVNGRDDAADRHAATSEPRAPGPAFAALEDHVGDLSLELSDALPRRPGEWVRCRRISGDHYRCNWWGRRDASSGTQPDSIATAVTMHRVVRSQMLRATKTTKGISIDPDPQQ
jgi:hypothetical protein